MKHNSIKSSMKTSLPSFLVILILINSCTSQSDKNFKKFTLQGEINGQDSGIVVLSYPINGTLICDTAKIKNGKFIFTGRVFEPTRVSLRGRNSLELAWVYLEPRNMKITIFKGKPLGFKMTGSKTQTELDLLNKMEKTLTERLSMLREQLFNIDDSIKNLKPGPAKQLLKKKAEETDSLWSQTYEKLYPIELKFVLQHPKSFVTPFYLHMLEGNKVISLDSAKSIFNGLDSSLKKSEYGKYIIEDIREKENTRIGAQAPDFKAIDLNQQTVTLSQFKGKSIVLLDFWASWCVPCRQSIPHLKTIYKKYHSKGFDVIAVSEDSNRKAWIEAVKKDSTGMWYHIPIAEKWPCKPSQMTNDDIYKNYFVQSVPEQILIDKNGKIIYRHVGYSKESEELLDKQLSQIFDK